MRAIVVRLALAAFLAGAVACSSSTPPAAPAADAALSFRRLYEREWRWRLQENPLFASTTGERAFDERLPSESLESYARRDRETQGFLKELAGIDRNVLEASDRINYDIFRAQLEDRVGAYRFGEHLMPLNADSGFHTSFALVPQSLRFETARDYANYLARLRAFPRYMDENIALMREGLRRGITLPRVSLQGIEQSIEPLITDAPESSPLYVPFTKLAPAVAADGERLAREGRAAIAEAVVPAYRTFLAFMTGEYLPKTRETLAAIALPDGQAYYDFLVARFTTLPLTAAEVHDIGLREVQAIRAEMDAVIATIGFRGDFAAFLAFLRTDPRFYAKTPDELIRAASYIAKRIDAKLPSQFGRLPRQPYGVVPVPAYLAPKYTAGRYSGNPREGTEPGYYWVNTHALETRPLYNLEALTLHEAVPGHHLQGALAEELDSVPPFRRYSYISAFGEGWGLYSEWLGRDMGFYTDPYSDFGRLTYAMWRAVRLVVDTGIHAKGWTRQHAIDYLASHTALSIHECTTETDRYISWPGQALSYKIGELKIRELRRKAEQTLGPRFNVRRFHDAVLGQGSVPLPVLEGVVDTFVATERAAR